MKMIKLSNIAQDLILENILLNEVGEGVEPYELREITSGPNYYTAEFSIMPQEGEVPIFMTIRVKIVTSIIPTLIIPICNLPYSSIKILTISFSNKGGEYYTLTGRNQVYKVLSTVVKYTNSVLKRNPDVVGIAYSSSGNEKASSQRYKIYSAYLTKELSKQGSKYVPAESINFEMGFKLKAIKADAYTCITKYIDNKGVFTFSNIDLKGAYLSRALLSGVTFRNVTLQGANLSNANLENAKFYEATDLSGADLTEADLTRADLTEVNLSYANLKGAYLVQTILTGADLSFVKNLDEAEYLRTVIYDKTTIWPEGFNIEDYK